MKPDKIYTVKEHHHSTSSRNHRLVRAAGALGLTNIKIEWYSLKEYMKANGYRYGWYLTCDQIATFHIGYEVKQAEERIKKIEMHIKIKVYGSTDRK